MSLNQAFQTAVAYRQGMIDRNMDAAMQTPMIAIQALNVGLQAQAQSQQAQLQMQGMVLQNQLQIEEMKSKQAMQVMQFDFQQKKFQVDQQAAAMDFGMRKQALDANLSLNALNAQQALQKMEFQKNGQLAQTFFGQLYANGVTDEQIASGIQNESLAAFTRQHPVAGAMAATTVAEKRNAMVAALDGQLADMSLARDKALMDPKMTQSGRQAAWKYMSSQMQPLEAKRAMLKGVPETDLSYQGIGSLMSDFGPATGVPIEDLNATLGKLLDTYNAAPVEAQPAIWDQITEIRAQLPGAAVPVKPTGMDAAANMKELAALADKMRAQNTMKNRNTSSAMQVENATRTKAEADLVAWEKLGGTKAANALDAVINSPPDAATAAEAKRLRNTLDAALEATRRGLLGTRKRTVMGVSDGATAVRSLTPDETADPRAGTPPARVVRSFTQAELDQITRDPSFENVKAILSRLEVR